MPHAAFYDPWENLFRPNLSTISRINTRGAHSDATDRGLWISTARVRKGRQRSGALCGFLRRARPPGGQNHEAGDARRRTHLAVAQSECGCLSRRYILSTLSVCLFSNKLQAVTSEGIKFGPPGYEVILLY